MNIKRFLDPALHDKWMLARGVFIYAVIYGYPYLNVYIIRELTAKTEIGDLEGFSSILMFFVVSVIIFFMINFFCRNWGNAEMQYSFMKNIHRTYMSRFLELDNNKVESIGTGKMIAILNSGISNWTGALIDNIKSIIQFSLAFFFAIYIFKNAGYGYLIAFILMFGAFYIFLHKMTILTIEKRKQRTEAEVLYNNQFVKMIMSKFEIYQNSKTKKEVMVLDSFSDEAKSINLSLNQYYYYQYLCPKAFLSIFRIIVYFTIGYGIFQQTHRISELVGMIMLLTVIEDTFYKFIDFFMEFTKKFSYIRKLWETFDSIPPIQERKGLPEFKLDKGNIVIEGLSYSYGEKKIFDDFGLEIIGGKKTAIVGHSGSGKTTLAKLIIGYLRADSGTVKADMQDIQEIDMQSYYENIGYLTQDPSVFDGSIFENLTYGARHEVTESELKKAIKQAQCEFIYEFSKGLETQIGERGVRLSGGQKQRLAIAKIFIKNPKIIVLDEPTSALDSFSEEKISEAFHNLFADRAVIVIAHRLQTVKEADDIIVLENGELIERGKHKELVEKGGIYAKMLKLQSGF